MGSEIPMIKIPIVDLSSENLKPGTDKWFLVQTQVCRALEEYGCFEAIYHDVPLKLHNAMFSAIQEVLDLPLETKIKNKPDKHFFGYFEETPASPISEGTGIYGAPVLERVQSFTKLMWPNGNDNFCETVHSFTNRALDLAKKAMEIVFEGYGVQKYNDSHAKSITALLRVNKYRGPGINETMIAIPSHTDKTFVTILQQNHVNGLEIKARNGEWVSVIPLPGSFIVMAGDAFLAWSNGRLHSPEHRVVHKGDKTRYSLALFTFSKNLVEAPGELVDEEEHPLMFKPFDNIGLIDFYYTKEGQKVESPLKAYCGV